MPKAMTRETADAEGPATPPEGFVPGGASGFVDLVGPVYVRQADGAFGFRAEEKHANLIGVVHGGMLMSLADRALGVAAMRAADGANCVTIELGMQFVGAGRIGTWIEARPFVVRRTGSLVFLRGEVVSGGDVLASASGVWKILRRRPSEPVPGAAADPS